MSWRAVEHDELLQTSGADPYVVTAVPTDAVAIVGEHGWAAMHPCRPSGHWGYRTHHRFHTRTLSAL